MTSAAGRPAGDLRVLLLQIRDHPVAERQERECFVDFSGLAAGQFRFHNLLADPDPGWEKIAEADAVVIGGAGAHSATARHAFTRPLARIVERLVAERRPLFGSCFGHQFIAQELGGRVVTDLERKELGTHDVALTDAGERDPLFRGLPRRFAVQLGHHDRVVELPRGATELAYSALCRNQAFRIAGAPVWGCQFHVELDERRMLERAGIYRSGYLPGDDAVERLAAALRPAPEAAELLPRFFAAAFEAARSGV
jgi:GMP synthase (glutamine-hydrolysing)